METFKFVESTRMKLKNANLLLVCTGKYSVALCCLDNLNQKIWQFLLAQSLAFLVNMLIMLEECRPEPSLAEPNSLWFQTFSLGVPRLQIQRSPMPIIYPTVAATEAFLNNFTSSFLKLSNSSEQFLKILKSSLKSSQLPVCRPIKYYILFLSITIG